MVFHDRRDAGRRLAAALSARPLDRPVILAIPRGGVPVAAEIATELGAELGVVVAGKLRAPERPELAIGAVTADGSVYVDQGLAAACGADTVYLRMEAERALAEARRRVERFGRWAQVPLAGRTAVVVDDGVATGATVAAACRAVRRAGAADVVVAVPVGPPDTIADLASEADAVVCLRRDPHFVCVGNHYADFQPVDEEQVARILESFAGGGPVEKTVQVPAGAVALEGTLAVPPDARGVVLFAHGSGSSRFSLRNRAVAERLRDAGLATLLIDLLTPAEEAADERTTHLRFDMGLLADRVCAAAIWLARRPETERLPIGCFGASTGGGAALVAAAREPHRILHPTRTGPELCPSAPGAPTVGAPSGWGPRIRAVVSRGGRPDLAGDCLPLVLAPTLLIVGANDAAVLRLNEAALDRLGGEKRLEVIPAATHLFEEPGALDEVGRLAAAWFARHLGRAAPTPRRHDDGRPEREPGRA